MPQEIAQFGFYLCSVAKSRLWCIVCVCARVCVYIYLCVRILQVLSFEGVTPGCAHKRTVFNVRL